jgi:hypothetical protein
MVREADDGHEAVEAAARLRRDLVPMNIRIRRARRLAARASSFLDGCERATGFPPPGGFRLRLVPPSS